MVVVQDDVHQAGVKVAPHLAQITAGTEITDSVADISGFQFSNSPIPIPKLSNTFTPTIAGEDTADDSSGPLLPLGIVGGAVLAASGLVLVRRRAVRRND